MPGYGISPDIRNSRRPRDVCDIARMTAYRGYAVASDLLIDSDCL